MRFLSKVRPGSRKPVKAGNHGASSSGSPITPRSQVEAVKELERGLGRAALEGLRPSEKNEPLPATTRAKNTSCLSTGKGSSFSDRVKGERVARRFGVANGEHPTRPVAFAKPEASFL